MQQVHGQSESRWSDFGFLALVLVVLSVIAHLPLLIGDPSIISTLAILIITASRHVLLYFRETEKVKLVQSSLRCGVLNHQNQGSPGVLLASEQVTLYGHLKYSIAFLR